MSMASNVIRDREINYGAMRIIWDCVFHFIFRDSWMLLYATLTIVIAATICWLWYQSNKRY
jgi:uncharacterized membrane protein YdfJ with MMPL/SSD domain